MRTDSRPVCIVTDDSGSNSMNDDEIFSSRYNDSWVICVLLLEVIQGPKNQMWWRSISKSTMEIYWNITPTALSFPILVQPILRSAGSALLQYRSHISLERRRRTLVCSPHLLTVVTSIITSSKVVLVIRSDNLGNGWSFLTNKAQDIRVGDWRIYRPLVGSSNPCWRSLTSVAMPEDVPHRSILE